MHELDPTYLGYMSTEEVITLLNQLLEGERAGARVGLMDGDIYGPNVPIMLGVHTQLTTDGKRIVPAEKHGLQIVSMGFLTSDDAAVIWRGPMASSALKQFIR